MIRSVSACVFSAILSIISLPQAALGQNCGYENQAACPTCPPVVQHIHKYRHHHHCAPPCGVVVPSMAMMPVMAAPVQYAPVAAAPVQYAPVAAPPPVQYAPAAPVTYQVQAAPAVQVQAAPVQLTYAAPAAPPAAPQYALVQLKPESAPAAPRAPGSNQDACQQLLEMLRERSGAAAPASAPAAAPSGAISLEERVSILEGKVKVLEDNVADWNATAKDVRELLQALKKQ